MQIFSSWTGHFKDFIKRKPMHFCCFAMYCSVYLSSLFLSSSCMCTPDKSVSAKVLQITKIDAHKILGSGKIPSRKLPPGNSISEKSPLVNAPSTTQSSCTFPPLKYSRKIPPGNFRNTENSPENSSLVYIFVSKVQEMAHHVQSQSLLNRND